MSRHPKHLTTHHIFHALVTFPSLAPPSIKVNVDMKGLKEVLKLQLGDIAFEERAARETKEEEGNKVGGGHFDSDKITPLMRAATHEDPSQLMDLLVSSHARATLFVKDSRGRTALDWARLVNNEMSVIALRKAMLTSINDSRADMVGNAMDVAERLRAANKDATRKLMEALKQRDAMAAMEVRACVRVCVCVCLPSPPSRPH